MLALRALIVLTICLLTVGARSQSQPPPEEHSQTHQPKFRNYHEYPATAELGTDKSPIIVRIIPTPKTDAEAAQDKKDRENKSTQDQSLVAYSTTLDVLTAILVAVGALQLFVFGYQAWQLRQTVAAMKGQSEDMRASIAEANRAANAMENMSVSLKINADKIVEAIEINKQTSLDQRNFWLRQMRSYLSVVIGVAIYQERDRGIRFEARPSIKNNGSTPAYNVRYRASAALLPVAMQNDLNFTSRRNGAATPQSGRIVRWRETLLFLTSFQMTRLKLSRLAMANAFTFGGSSLIETFPKSSGV